MQKSSVKLFQEWGEGRIKKICRRGEFKYNIFDTL
jgi:hypothetical protein